MEKKRCKVIFINDDGSAMPVEFVGECANLFVSLRETFANLSEEDLKSFCLGAIFSKGKERGRLVGGMGGDSNALARIIVSMILQYAPTVPDRPLPLVVADICDMALKKIRSRQEVSSSGDVILPKAVLK